MASNQVSDIHGDIRCHGVVVAKSKVKCNYCGKIVSSGFYRLKYHLGGVKGDVTPCLSVPEPVKLNFENELKGKKGKVLLQTDIREPVQQRSPLKRKSNCLEITPYNNDIDAQIDSAEGQLTNHHMLSDEELRRWTLSDTLDEMNKHLKEIKASWESTGCSILLDIWRDLQDKKLINILVSCPKGTIYLKSFDISNFAENGEALQLLIEEVIEDVGSKNVVQIISNSTSTLMEEVARKQIMAKHRHIFWTISLSTCIDLMRERFMEISGKQIVIPLLHELHSFTGNNKLETGYIYDRIDRLKETIQHKLKNTEFQYVPFWYAIDEVWNNHLHSHLHSAGYYLNPYLFYSDNFYCDLEVATGLSDCIVRMSGGDYSTRRSIRLQVVEYLMKKRSPSESAMNQPTNSCPVLWWSKNEREYPELSRMAIRILSQTCDGASKFKFDRKFAEILINEERPMEKKLRTNYAFVHYNKQLRNFDPEIRCDDIGPSNNQRKLIEA